MSIPTACREMSLAEVRAAEPIPSGYRTDRIYRATRFDEIGHFGWTLQEEWLDRPMQKVYDDGDVDEWLESYREAAALESMRFAGAFSASRLLGLVTWTHVKWNNSLWLVDIRVRPDLRRSGVGRRLIRHVQQESAITQARGIRLETQAANYPAIQFYLELGFKPSGVDDHLYSNRDLAHQDVALFFFWERA